jgi:hypothetical protein
MRVEYYKCDICLRKLPQDEGIVTFTVPVNFSFKRYQIIKKEMHVCESCYKPEYFNKVKEYEDKFKANMNEFFRSNKFYF